MHHIPFAPLELVQATDQHITPIVGSIQVPFKLATDRLQDSLGKKLSLTTLFFAVGQYQVVRDRTCPGVKRLVGLILVKLLPDTNPQSLHDLLRVLPAGREGIYIGKQTPFVGTKQPQELFRLGTCRPLRCPF